MTNDSDASPVAIGSIKAPSETPSTTADNETNIECAVLGSKALTAAQSAQKSHADHLKTLQDHIAYHFEECKVCRSDKLELQTQLDQSRATHSDCCSECTKLREIAYSVRWVMLFGNTFLALGSISLGIAGASPSLSNDLKLMMTSGGACLAICGIILTIFAFFSGRRANK